MAKLRTKSVSGEAEEREKALGGSVKIQVEARPISYLVCVLLLVQYFDALYD